MRIKLTAAYFFQFCQGLIQTEGTTVTAVGGHGVKSVCYGNYSRLLRYIFACQTIGIAFAVITLMMATHPGYDILEPGYT